MKQKGDEYCAEMAEDLFSDLSEHKGFHNLVASLCNQKYAFSFLNQNGWYLWLHAFVDNYGSGSTKLGKTLSQFFPFVDFVKNPC
jgi:hypothetical protein